MREEVGFIGGCCGFLAGVGGADDGGLYNSMGIRDGIWDRWDLVVD